MPTNKEILFVIRMRNEAQRGLRRFGTDTRRVAQDTRRAARRVREASTNIDRVGVSSRRASRDLQRLGRDTNRLRGQFRGLASVAGQLTAGLGIGAVVSQSARSFIEFEASLAKIQGLVGLSRDTVQGFGQEILKLAGSQTLKSPQELADALFFITSAGARGAEAVDILRRAAQASAAGLGETKDVALAATSALNAFRGTGLTAADAINVIVNTARQGNFETRELAGALGRILPVAAEAGVSLDQVGGAIASLTRQGLPAAEAITQTRAVLTALNKPSEEGRKILRSVGLSFQQIREQIRERGLLETLQSLRERLGGNTEALSRVLGSSEALNAVLVLTGRNIETSRQIFGALAKSGGILEEAFRAIAGTIDGRLKAAIGEINTNFIRFGREIAPTVADVLVLVSRNLDLILGAIVAVAGALAARLVITLVRSTVEFGKLAASALLASRNVATFRRTAGRIGSRAIAASVGVITTAFFLLRKEVRDGITQLDLFESAATTILGRTVRRLEGIGLTVSGLLLNAFGGSPELQRQIAARLREIARTTGGNLSEGIKKGFREDFGAAIIAGRVVDTIIEAGGKAQRAAESAGKGTGKKLAQSTLTEFQKALSGFGEDDFRSQLEALVSRFLPAVAATNDLRKAQEVLAVASKASAAELAKFGLTQAQLAALSARVASGFRVEKNALEQLIDATNRNIQFAGLENNEKRIQIALARVRTEVIKKEGAVDAERLRVLEQRLRLEQQTRGNAQIQRTINEQIRSLENETRLLGVQGEARRRLEATIQLENQARQAGVRVTAAQRAELTKVFVAAQRARQDFQGDAFGGLRDGLQNVVDQAGTVREQFTAISETIGGAFGDELAKAFETGKFSFQDLEKTIISGLARIAAQAAISNIAGAIFGTQAGSPSQGGSGGVDFSQLIGVVAGLFHEGGSVDAPRQFKAVSPKVFKKGHVPRFRTGGGIGLSPNERPAILDKGEFVLTRQQTQSLANGDLAIGQPGSAQVVQDIDITINVQTPDVESFRRSEGQIGREAALAIGRFSQRNT